ncbi:quinate repressor [Pyrenophora tritici-repentis Pt-1C-BFP]|uniref:Quinate repressor n=1 Tax=Pyrenophora tritici-repentis (strain Pt-1C-BFP) TaxID=426418 RepID=B2WEU3_PYRTR|nr:quinate repressor [Pyrenophora tritici-repentis Pt-1C-BFP]EDU51585.1 quinate repressor [Pyrenophora tritici-repentis Pt-1C-BFP]
MDNMFLETTGFSTAKYRKQFGPANYNLRQEELLRTVLREDDRGSIIVCNGVSLERKSQALLQDFGRTHPVILVQRDLSSIHNYLGGPDLQRLKDMLSLTAPVLRACSNYEFYNISEIKTASTDALPDHPVAPAFLTLKRAQRTFLKFLSLITTPEHANSPGRMVIPPLEPGYPLADVAIERRKYTCAVQVSTEDILTEDANIQSLEVGSDAFEIVLDLSQKSQTADLMNDVSACMSKVRRSTVVPIIYHVLPTSSADGSRTLYLQHVYHGLRLAPEYATIDLSLDPRALADVIATRGTTRIIGHLHTDKAWDDHFWVTQYEMAEVTKALYTSFTLDPMKMYIIGIRIGYSVSPAMHNLAYEACGMPHEFIRIESPSLSSLKELVRKPNFGGSIVIQPFKMEVIALVDSLSQHARAIGAVNTVIPVRRRNQDGNLPSDLGIFQERNQSGPIQALYGDNTEWIGLRSCLGVMNIAIFNRTYEKAESLVAHFSRLAQSSVGTSSPNTPKGQPSFVILKSREDPWPEHLRQPTIIISCIPADPIDDRPAAHFTLPAQWMESATGGVVMETAYKTLNTPLMQQMVNEPKKLWTYMDGLDFIPEQAFAQFELFTGKRAPRRVMREEALRAWRDEQGNSNMEMVRRRLKAIDDQEP